MNIYDKLIIIEVNIVIVVHSRLINLIHLISPFQTQYKYICNYS